MKRNDTIRAIGISVSWTLLLAGCSTESGTDAPQRAIGFTTTVTRSAVTSLGNEGDAFSVWARETPSGTRPLILTRETVTCTGGSWQYDDLQYWRDEATYDFLPSIRPDRRPNWRIIPSRGDSVLAHQGFRRTRSVDLMTAEKTGLAYQPPAQRVAFTFRHLLSQIQIIGRIDPALAASEFRRRYARSSSTACRERGVRRAARRKRHMEPRGGDGCRQSFARDPVSRELTPAGISVFADDLLLFPQQVGDGFVLEIEYEYAGTARAARSQRASASPAQALAHGKQDAATAIPSRWAASTSCSRNRRSFPGPRPRAATSR
ncbi:MAG: fimbrillin family protein [Alistipes sp.]